MMKNRLDIRNFILFIEANYPVNEWKINDIHIWPILRIRLYFYLINKIESGKNIFSDNIMSNKKSVTNYSFYKKKGIQLKSWLRKIFCIINFYKWFFKLPKKQNVFLGADSHRVEYKQKRYNRYFDVFIEKFNLFKESILFEYGGVNIDNHFNKEMIWKYDEALKGFIFRKKMFFRKRNSKKELVGYDSFIKLLESNLITSSFSYQNSYFNLVNYIENNFLEKINFFEKVLKRVEPKKLIVLCYYSEEIMAFIVAANKLGVETFEMQHGPQSDIHLAYGSWSNIPTEGYDMLPRKFWCWDNNTKKMLDFWMGKSRLYSSQVVGNPWVEYWKRNPEIYFHHNYILYSLQPDPYTIEKLFPPVLIEFIRKQKYKWFIRLHPRQLDQRNKLEEFLHKNEILHLVNIEDATNDPLPQLLTNCIIHITNFSGSAIEASFFNVFTVLISEIGMFFFPDLIENKEAIYLDLETDNFTTQLGKIIENNICIDKRKDAVSKPTDSFNNLFS